MFSMKIMKWKIIAYLASRNNSTKESRLKHKPSRPHVIISFRAEDTQNPFFYINEFLAIDKWSLITINADRN